MFSRRLKKELLSLKKNEESLGFFLMLPARCDGGGMGGEWAVSWDMIFTSDDVKNLHQIPLAEAVKNKMSSSNSSSSSPSSCSCLLDRVYDPCFQNPWSNYDNLYGCGSSGGGVNILDNFFGNSSSSGKSSSPGSINPSSQFQQVGFGPYPGPGIHNYCRAFTESQREGEQQLKGFKKQEGGEGGGQQEQQKTLTEIVTAAGVTTMLGSPPPGTPWNWVLLDNLQQQEQKQQQIQNNINGEDDDQNNNNRFQKIKKMLYLNPYWGLVQQLKNPIVQELRVHFPGAKDSLYKGEYFVLQFRLTSQYPMDAPEVTFITGPNLYGTTIPLHPHIYSNGHICLSILSKDWSPALDFEKIILSIQSMLSSCTKKERPDGDLRYCQSVGSKSPKLGRWIFDDEKA